MAYVTARRNGRFEIRESLHTPAGPRARTLVGFTMLSGGVLARAERRATRPFDTDAVIASGRRAGAPVEAVSVTAASSAGPPSRFVAASRRMAGSLRRTAELARRDPGEELIELLGFADAVRSSQPARTFERLRFPVLSQLSEPPTAAAGSL